MVNQADNDIDNDSNPSEMKTPLVSNDIFEVSLSTSNLGLYLLQKRDESRGKDVSGSVDTKIIAFKMDLDLSFRSKMDEQTLNVDLNNLRASQSNISNLREQITARSNQDLDSHKKLIGSKESDIILPLQINFNYSSTPADIDMDLSVSDAKVVVSPGALESITHYVEDAVAPLLQPGPDKPVFAVSKYQKIVSLCTKSFSRDGTEEQYLMAESDVITIWRPHLRTGCMSVGDVVTLGNRAPSFEAVSLSRNSGLVSYPLSFQSVFSNEEICIWVPMAPVGYSSIGFFVTTDGKPPSIEDVCCIGTKALISVPKGSSVPISTKGSILDLINVDNSFGSFLVMNDKVDLEPLDLRYPIGPTSYALSLIPFMSDAGSRSMSNDLSRKLQMTYVETQRKANAVKARSVNSSKTTEFRRVWTDMGSLSESRGVSIWRPIAPPGYWILGDCFMNGFDPPSYVYTLRTGVSLQNIGGENLADPVKFDLIWHDGNPKIDKRLSVWNPVAPKGYIAMGNIVHIGTGLPNVDVKCICEKFASSGLTPRSPMWRVRGDQMTINPLSTWRVDEQTCCFVINATDSATAPEGMHVLNMSSINGDAGEDPGRTVNVVVRARSFDIVFYDSFRMPILRSKINNIESGIRGYSQEVVQSYGGFQPSIMAYNSNASCWEPILEPFDAIIKVDANFKSEISSGIEPGIHISIKSSSELIFTTLALSHVNAVISSYEECVTALAKNGRVSDHEIIPALGEKWLRNSVIVNSLGVDLEFEVESIDGVDSFSILSGHNQKIERSAIFDPLDDQITRKSTWTGGMLLLDIGDVYTAPDDSRIMVAAYFKSCNRGSNPRTRALKVSSGHASFNERLVLTCSGVKVDYTEVVVEVWDVQGNLGQGLILDSGTFSTGGLSNRPSDVNILLQSNNQMACKACWQRNPTIQDTKADEQNLVFHGQHTEQRAISIKGSQNVWKIIPELSRRITGGDKRNLSVIAVELGGKTVIVEGSIENHMWHEHYRSNCMVSNMTDLPIKISLIGSKEESITDVGPIEPNKSKSLPLGWDCGGKSLGICPGINIESVGKLEIQHEYNWGRLQASAQNECIGIPLANLSYHRHSRFVLSCESKDQSRDSMMFSAVITPKFVQGTDLIDWVITVVPPITIRNHIPLSISLSLYNEGKALGREGESTIMRTGDKLPIYFLGSRGSLQFEIACSGYKWAEQGLATLTGTKLEMRNSVRICEERQRIPSEIMINRASMSSEFQNSNTDLANRVESPYPMTVTLSSPLWILNKTECCIEIATTSISNDSRKISNQVGVDFVHQKDPVYDSVILASDGNGSEQSSLANSRKIESRSMLLMGMPNAKDGVDDKTVSYGIKIRVQNSGWTEAILFDQDYATKHGYICLSSVPLLIMNESRLNSKVYGIVLYLETGEFGESRILHIESQILLQNNSRVPVQAFQCATETKPILKGDDAMVLPMGGIYLGQQQSDSLNKGYSINSFVQMPDNALNDMLQAKAIFDIPEDSITRAMNFSKLNTTSVCLRQSDDSGLENVGIWSRPVQMNRSEEGFEYIVIPRVSGNSLEESILLRIRFSFRGPGLKSIIIESAECLPNYVLINKTPFRLMFAQPGSESAHDLPEFSASGCVPEFTATSKLRMEVYGPNLRSYSKILDLGEDMETESKELSISSSNVCTIHTSFENMCTTSPFGNIETVENGSGYVVGRGGTEKVVEILSGPSSLQHSLQRDNEMEYFVSLEVPCVSISIIDLKPQELALITMEDIKINFDKIVMPDRLGAYIQVVTRHIQIDNQLPGTLLPVSLCKALGTRSNLPMVDFKYSTFYSKNRSSIQLPYIGFRIPIGLQVAIEESLIWKLHAVYEYMSSAYPPQEQSKITAAVDPFVKLRLLSVGEAPLSVSFQNNRSMRPASLQDSSLSLILDLAAFKGADVRLKGFELENVHTTFSGFTARVQEKIKGELMSAGFSLVRTFGFVGGAQRLLGFLGAQAVKFAGTSGGNVSQRSVPEPADEMPPEEASSFGSSMLQGFKGLVNKPIEGARAEGFEGAFKGMAKGVVGVFTAPVSNSLAKTPETYDASFAKGRSSVLVLQRKRLPRVLGASGTISAASKAGSIGESVLESLGQSFLWATLIADSSRADRLESYEEHFVLPDGFVLIFTNMSMIHVYSPDFAVMDGAAEIGSLSAIEIPSGTIKWRIFWWDLLAMEIRWSDPRLDPDRLVIHRKGNERQGSRDISLREIKDAALAQEIFCFPKTPQASQIKFVANKILSKYYRDPTRQDNRWAIRHAARLTLQPGGSAMDLPFQMLCSEFEQSWHTNPARSPVVYFWKPVAPPGYKPVGTVATLGPDQPLYPVHCFRDDVTLQRQSGEHRLPTAFPEEYSLIWRFNGARPVSIWMPIPPQGYVAMGAIIVPDASVPSMDDYVCIREDLVEQTPLFDSAIWSYNPEALKSEILTPQKSKMGMRSDAKINFVPEPRPSYLPETWKVSVWQIDSPLMTLLVARGLKKPPQQLSFTLIKKE